MLLTAGLVALLQQAAAGPPPQRPTIWSATPPAGATRRRPGDEEPVQPVPTVRSSGSVFSDRGSGFVLEIPLGYSWPNVPTQARLEGDYFRGARVCFTGEIRSPEASVTSWVRAHDELHHVLDGRSESLGKPEVWKSFAVVARIPYAASRVAFGFLATGPGLVETRGVRLIREGDWASTRCGP